jgi:coiled-coil domain-containing protein 78
LKTFNDKEKENAQTLERREKYIDDQRKKIRALKRYGREVKYLAEDWAPKGEKLPDILVLPPPVSLEDDDQDDYMRRQ